MKLKLRYVFPVISLAAILFSSCSASITVDPTQAAAAIYTSAAQTIVAKATITQTLKPSETPSPTDTPTITITPTVTETVPPTPVPPTSPVDNFCDNSSFIKDVTIPDHTILAPGQVFDKTWTFQNTGICSWTIGYTIIFSDGNQMSGNSRSINQVVAPQQQVDVTVKLKAPTTPGEYIGYWRLANSKGKQFGKVVSVIINVSPNGGTLTPQP